MRLRTDYDRPDKGRCGPTAFSAISPSICSHKIILRLPPTTEASRIRRPEHSGCGDTSRHRLDAHSNKHVGVVMNSRDIGLTQAFTAPGTVRKPQHHARRSGACLGFTLIEVVVALAVVATLLTAIGA